MNSKAFNHLTERLSEPSDAKRQANQKTYNATRYADFVNAKLWRPQFLTILHDLEEGAQTLPISKATEEVEYDVVIHGAISDGTNRGINFRERDEKISVGDYGDYPLSLDAFAGKSVGKAGTTGVVGVQDFAYPMPLRAKRTLTLDVYKKDEPAEVMHTVLNANRVFMPTDREAQISAEEREEILQQISRDISPRDRYATCPVVFSNGKAKTETPKFDEPLLIIGFRSTFTDAKVNLGFSSADSFAIDSFPLWALANEPGNTKQLFQRLKKPLYVGIGKQLYFKFENTIDGVTYADNGQIEILLRTA